MAASSYLFAVVCASYALCGSAQGANISENISSEAGGMAVKFMGKSGKFEIYSKNEGEEDQNKIRFEIAELREMSVAGEEVGKKVSPTHQLKDFKKTEFSFDVTNGVTVGTAVATRVSFESNISGLGVLKVDTFLISQQGQVGLNLTDPEMASWDAIPGDVKFNIELKEWRWCGTTGSDVECKSQGKGKGDTEVGQYLDVDIEVKGPKSKAGETKKGKGGKGSKTKFDLGGGVGMDMASDVVVDGEDNLMPDGYPMLVMKGSKQIFTFRFPRFNSSALYDPLLGTGSSVSKVTTETTSTQPAFDSAAERLASSTLAVMGGFLAVGLTTAA